MGTHISSYIVILHIYSSLLHKWYYFAHSEALGCMHVDRCYYPLLSFPPRFSFQWVAKEVVALSLMVVVGGLAPV